MKGNYPHTHFAAAYIPPAFNAVEPPAARQSSPQLEGLDYFGATRLAGESACDLLEYTALPTGAGLAVGTIFGYGAQSSRMASAVKAALTGSGVPTVDRPTALLQAANRVMCAASLEDSYAAMFYAAIDPFRRELRYVNAGHESGLLLRYRSQRLVRLENTGAVLGLTPRSIYGQRTVSLEPGDALVVFSDGVAEAIDLLGRPFGSKGVLQVLRADSGASAASLVGAILEAAERHAGWANQIGDQTVAALRFTPGEAETVEYSESAELAFAAA